MSEFWPKTLCILVHIFTSFLIYVNPLTLVNVHQYQRCHIPQDWIIHVLDIHARNVKICHSHFLTRQAICYKRNYKTPSHSRCSCGRGGIDYSKRVCILATFLLRIILLLVASLVVPHFSKFIH